MMDFSLLTDDCLISIFRHLTLLERFKFEQVCTRWQSLMPYEDISVLDFRTFDWPEKCFCEMEAFFEPVVAGFWICKALDKILPRCGRFLKTFRFMGKHILMSPSIFRVIVSFCPNLTTFICGDLAKFHVSCVPLFSRLENLEYLNLRNTMFLNQEGELTANFEAFREHFQCVLNAHQKLQELDLPRQTMIPNIRNTRVKKLTFYYFGMSSGDFASLIQSYPNLVHLELDRAYGSGVQDFRPIASLDYLESLCLQNTGRTFSDEHLKTICRNCPRIWRFHLKTVPEIRNFSPLGLLINLSDLWVESRFFNNANLADIVRHGKLEILHAYDSEMSDQGISMLKTSCPNLTKLGVPNSKLIGDKGLMPLVAHCKNLTCLDVSGTTVSYNFLNAVGTNTKKLRELILTNCFKIDGGGLWQLFEARSAMVRQNWNLVPELNVFVSLTVPLSEHLVLKCRQCKMKIFQQRL